MPENRNIKALYWNAQGLRRKTNELRYLLDQNDIDICFISETKLNNSSLANFKNYRKLNRPYGIAGGLAAYIKINIKFSELSPLDTTFENIAIKINGQYIIGVYNRPGNELTNDDLDKLMALGSKVLVIGDFNAKHQEWNNNRNNREGNKLKTYADNNNMLIHFPDEHTHFPDNNNQPSTLDIVLNKNSVIEPPVALNELQSDHRPIQIEIHMTHNIQNVLKPIKIYSAADWRLFRQYINENTIMKINFENNQELDDYINTVTTTLQHAMRIAIPERIPLLSKEILPQEIIDLIRIRNRKRAVLQRNYSALLKQQVRELDGEIRVRLRSFREEKWTSKLANLNVRDGSIYKLAKALRKSKDTFQVPPLKNNDNLLIHEDDDKAELLAESLLENHKLTRHLSDQPTKIIVQNSLLALENTEIQIPRYFETSPKEVKNIIRLTRPRKAPGEDGLQNIILKNLPRKMVVQLYYIYNYCLKNCYFPRVWKNAVVLPFKKPGKDYSNPKNYRPISLLTTLSKILEKLILTRLNKYLDDNKILIDEQYGFRPQHSTTLQIAKLLDNISIGHNNMKNTLMATLDVEKAFDSVWHDGLIHKLMTYEIPTHITKIIKSFLGERFFSVKVGESHSSKKLIPAGVPQGALLSPTLYLLFINDMPKRNDTDLFLFADDTAISACAHKKKLARDRLQRHLDDLKEYYDKWQIKVNATKTNIIYFAKRHRNEITDPLTYEGQDITEVPVVKYLGVQLDKKLLFKNHIEMINKKAKSVFATLYPLLRYDSRLGYKLKLMLYKCYIMPILTYAAPAWSSVSDHHLKSICTVQTKCLRMIINKFPWQISNQRLHEQTGLVNLKDAITRKTTKFYRDTVRVLEKTSMIATNREFNAPVRYRLPSRRAEF